MPYSGPKLKPSRYNTFVQLPESGKLLGFNSISGVAVEFPYDAGASVKHVLASPNGEYSDTDNHSPERSVL